LTVRLNQTGAVLQTAGVGVAEPVIAPGSPTGAAPDSGVQTGPAGASASPGDPGAQTIGRRTAHGAVVTTIAQTGGFALRMASMVVLARLVAPRDFGLVGMVTAFTGFLGLLRDGGLSMAAVQRSTITHDQTSTLFWINLAVGGILAALCGLSAPVLVRFYGEPRLFGIAIVIGLGFIFNGAAIQHRALLQRAMRFQALAAIDTVSLVVSIGLAIGAAAAGAGYWAIVVMTIGLPAAGGVGAWMAARWIPGPPRRGTGVRSMIWYGGAITLNNIIVYVAYNTDKVLLGRFWGAEALGIYGRAYQLINIPTENLNASVGLVAFPALSRMQHDPARLRDYFLKGHGLFLCLVMPIAAGCFLFADDIVRVFLGPKWSEAGVIFRLLSPTIVAFALVNPLAWIIFAAGHTVRALKISSLVVTVAIVGYGLGLRAGPQGVALGFSLAMTLLVVPISMWAVRDTAISVWDIGRGVMYPLLSIAAASTAAYVLHGWTNGFDAALIRLVVETAILFGTYTVVLLWVLGQKAKYSAILRQAGFWPARRGSNG
jgi:O-antigen/teichoic acid export membrane protein